MDGMVSAISLFTTDCRSSAKGAPMEFNKEEMINKLKFEIEMIEKGRYYPSVRDRQHEPEIFRDSVSCPNEGLETKQFPCSSCYLSEFLPPELRDSSGNACHQISLNDKGVTIESLKTADDPYKLQQAVLVWLKNTVARLEGELAREVATTN
jgi:hypothetical protein